LSEISSSITKEVAPSEPGAIPFSRLSPPQPLLAGAAEIALPLPTPIALQHIPAAVVPRTNPKVQSLLEKSEGRVIFGRMDSSVQLTSYEIAVNKAASELLRADYSLVSFSGSDLCAHLFIYSYAALNFASTYLA